MKNRFLSLLIMLFSIVLITACGNTNNQQEDNIILGDIVIDEEDIELGDLTIYDDNYYDDDFAPKDENLYNNEVPEETAKEDSAKFEESDENIETEINDDEPSESSMLEESSEETNENIEEVSKYETFDSVELDHMTPDQVYSWYVVNIADVDFFSEDNEQLLTDYYEYINHRFADDEEFSNYVLDQFIYDSFDMYFIQRPALEDFNVIDNTGV